MYNNYKFYAVTGQNGYGVYLNTKRAWKQHTYLVKFQLREFVDQEAAKAWAIEEFMCLQTQRIEPSPIKTLNWTYYPWKECVSICKLQPLFNIITEPKIEVEGDLL